jgi:hypothetical protein
MIYKFGGGAFRLMGKVSTAWGKLRKKVFTNFGTESKKPSAGM